VVYDRLTTRTGTITGAQQVFQLVSPGKPVITGPVATFAPAGTTAGTSSPHTLTLTTLIHGPFATPDGTNGATVHDLHQDDMDFNAGFRFEEAYIGGDNRALHVLAIDDAVTSALGAGNNIAMLVLKGGQQVTVAFNPNAVGGTLTIGNATPITLAAGVDKLPE
jgi:hypothetical protein